MLDFQRPVQNAQGHRNIIDLNAGTASKSKNANFENPSENQTAPHGQWHEKTTAYYTQVALS